MNNNNSIRQSTYSSTTVIIILAILVLAFIIVYLYNNYKDSKKKVSEATRPIPMCPDYWDSIGNGKCQNTNSLGSCSKMPGANIMDFNSEVFTNKTGGDYAKCKWAKACNVSWANVNQLC